MTNKLNANASSFTPSVMPMPGSFNDSFAQMAEDIEHEIASDDVADLTAVMNDTGVANVAPTNSGLPSHMQKHAAEFWFPESR